VRSPSPEVCGLSARVHRSVLGVSRAASNPSSVRSRSKQYAGTDCRAISGRLLALTMGTVITCRRRSRLTSSLKLSSLPTFNIVSSAHTISQSGPGPKHNERITDDSISKGLGP
jgi:hypothetical protein